MRVYPGRWDGGHPLVVASWAAKAIDADPSGDALVEWAKRGLIEGYIVEAAR